MPVSQQPHVFGSIGEIISGSKFQIERPGIWNLKFGTVSVVCLKNKSISLPVAPDLVKLY